MAELVQLLLGNPDAFPRPDGPYRRDCRAHASSGSVSDSHTSYYYYYYAMLLSLF